MKVASFVVGLVLVVSMACGCAGPVPTRELDQDAAGAPLATRTPAEPPNLGTSRLPADAQALVDLARDNLAGRLGEKAGAIALLSVEAFDFPDASLGVPEPDRLYAQVITPGYVIRLGVGDEVYTYHGSGERVVLAPESESSGGPAPAGNPFSVEALERALGSRMLNDPSALCEWEVWGSGENVVYLWAVCGSDSGSAVSAPAVAYLDGGGGVAAVNMPGDGTHYGPDVRRLFSPEVQERIFAHHFDARAAMERIGERRVTSR